jgi:rubrerythrin
LFIVFLFVAAVLRRMQRAREHQRSRNGYRAPVSQRGTPPRVAAWRMGSEGTPLAKKHGMARMIREVIAVLNELIALDYGAIDTFKAATARLRTLTDKTQVGQLMADHRRHVSELSLLVKNLGGEPVRHDAAPARRTSADVFEDIRAEEEAIASAYEEAATKQGIPIDVVAVLERNLAHERTHLAWLARRGGEARPSQARL